MKRIVLSIFIATQVCVGIYSQSTLNNGLVGYWPFNDNADDLSVNNNNGSFSGNAALTTNGRIQSACSFDGTGDYVYIANNSPNINSDFISISLWVYLDVLPTGYVSLFSQRTSVQDNGNIIVNISTSQKPYFQLDIGGGRYGATSPETIALGWTHIVGTYDGSTMRIYINGIEKATNVQLGVISYSADPFIIGAFRKQEGGTLNYLNGRIDEVCVYDRELSAVEITELYNGSPPIEWEPMDKNYHFSNGKVAIGGIPVTNDYLLSVEGLLYAKQIQVSHDKWADFVFSPEYQLMPINQVEQYIIENKHLPEIPSAEEVVKDGINLGEMNAKLLQKIEELTLYIIEQNKRIEELEKALNK